MKNPQSDNLHVEIFVHTPLPHDKKEGIIEFNNNNISILQINNSLTEYLGG